jgi:serine/threonine protein kinase
MVRLAATAYLARLKHSGLLSTAELNDALRAFQQHTACRLDAASTDELAQFLVARGNLNPWQSQRLCAAQPQPLVLGKYKLLALLGAGGMGAVFLAEHSVMRRRVAIKVLPQARVGDKQALARFLAEAQAIAALDHPHIVRAYSVDNQDEIYYLVMEHARGRTLDHVVGRLGPLTDIQSAEFVRQVADGLQHAHERDIIHRDIKPGNLLVDERGVVKILDLGLARLEAGQERGLTRDQVLGTTDYMAPEQALDSHAVDARADLYSLGCTWYWLLTGQAPFPAATLAESLIKHQTQQPAPVNTLRRAKGLPGVSDDLLAILGRLMAKRPAQRFESAAAVRDALAQWIAGRMAQGETAVVDLGDTLELVAEDTQLAEVLPASSDSVPQHTPVAEAALAPSGSTPRPGPLSKFLMRPPAADAQPAPADFRPQASAAVILAVCAILGVCVLSMAYVSGRLSLDPPASNRAVAEGMAHPRDLYQAAKPRSRLVDPSVVWEPAAAPVPGAFPWPFAAGNVRLTNPTATYSQPGWSVASAVDGRLFPEDTQEAGWGCHDGAESIATTAVFEFAQDVRVGEQSALVIRLAQGGFGGAAPHNLGCLRISVTSSPRDEFADGLTSGGDVSADWQTLDFVDMRSAGQAQFERLPDGSLLLSGVNPTHDVYTLTARLGAFTAPLTGLRIEALNHPSLVTAGPGRSANGNFILREVAVDQSR